jgi:CubicO group peptidase (beta-lactamase class C family)
MSQHAGIEALVPGLDAIIEPLLQAARIPGIAVAVVAGEETVLARGYGYRDLATRLPLASNTVYPIGSTTKAITATLLGLLADEGRISWDAPVRTYLPRFGLQDARSSLSVTLRDLLTMRTGLPRHDFLWRENRISRAELMERLAHLPLSASLRERFQYSNLTFTLAGHIAEVVAGRTWEELVRAKLLQPLDMNSTAFERPTTGNVTLSYHESSRRELASCCRLDAETIAPAGGSIYSTVEDMACWIAFNLNGGALAGRRLISQRTLEEIQSPWTIARDDPGAPSPGAAYALGWYVDTYNGCTRISHTGLLHDVQSCISLFPRDGLGIVSFSNFASSRVAPLVNQYAFDLIKGFTPLQTFEERLAQYEADVEIHRRRNAAVPRVENTSPSHPLPDYRGHYVHEGYGQVEIVLESGQLSFVRNNLALPLEHWHYDSWVVAENEHFEIHRPHVFERNNRVRFETNVDGKIDAFSMQVEPAVGPARFSKQVIE